MPKLCPSIHKVLIVPIFYFVIFSAAAQMPILTWSKTFDPYSAGNSNARTVGIDAVGNVYSAGFFEASVDFDPGPGVFMMTGGNYANSGVYISKLDANGNFLWARQIPALLQFSQLELKIDAPGNIYLVSETWVAADMDPGLGVFTISPIGFRDIFVVKLNTNGDFVWAKQIGGPGDTGPRASMLELDKDNNIIIAGGFNNTVDFDPGPAVYNITSSAHVQSFLIKLNNNGDFIWAKQFGNSPELYGGSNITNIECDASSNIVVIGGFTRTCDFDPGSGVYTVTSSPGSTGDGFIVKLDKNCNFIWAKTFGQTGSNNYLMYPTGIAIDGMGDIVTTGGFIGDFDFDPGPALNVHFSNPFDCYILKLTGQGDFIWVKIIGMATESDGGNDIAVDVANNVYVTGGFGTSIDFDPGPGVFMINNPYYGAPAVVKLSPVGDFRYAAAFQSISYGTSSFTRMVMDAAKNIYITGTATGVNDFDPGPGVFQVYGGPFVLKLGACLNATSSIQTVSTCNSYTLNNITYDSSGTYVQFIPNAAGCDSTITLNLTLNKKFVQQTKTICNGQSLFVGGISQTTSGIYYDSLHTIQGCDSIVTTYLTVNPSPIPMLGVDRNLCSNSKLILNPGNFESYLWQDNSHDPTFAVINTGNYWVKVTNAFNCSATDTFKVASLIASPSSFLMKTDSICNYKSLELMPIQSYNSYLWSTGATTKSIQVQSPGIYKLTVTDAAGCTAIESTTIFTKQCMYGVYIPNTFTPDNNGINDKFKALVFGKVVKFQLAVYNRWGTKVFETTDFAKGWDGKIAGIVQENGNFIWTCIYQLEGAAQKSEKGTILLMR
jgi:gliding motility-associated-like protein